MEINDIISSGLLELYATGLASEQEAKQVEQWVAQYPEVAEELTQIESAMQSYATANAVQPSSVVKENIFAAINKSRSTAPAKVIGIAPYWKSVAAASVILLLGSAVMNVLLLNKNKDVNRSLQEAQQIAGSLRKDNEMMKQDMHVVQDKYSMPVALKPMPGGMDATAKVFWMQNTGEVYIDPSSLPATPQGKQYELWAIVNGAPVNAGIVITTKKGDRYNIQKMKTFGKIEAFAISLEAENPTPATTPTTVVSMGKM
ncbi:anti-sigma factor [Ferruginibacter sp. SUN002]|uniref:anti-sigma factor n=1 Tax=Ferruginibacter sp. SUN002 TaxID=2937789 RepID=UPI003D36067A